MPLKYLSTTRNFRGVEIEKSISLYISRQSGWFILSIPFIGNLGTRFHITKYPTLKYVRNGAVAKREYRGQRSAESFVQFVEEQTTDPIKEFTALEELQNMGYDRMETASQNWIWMNVLIMAKIKTAFHCVVKI